MMNTMFVLLQAQGGQGGGSMLLWLVLIFVVMWLLMVRPQQKQAKKEREFRKNQKVIVVKEVQLSATIEEHDIDVKFRNAVKFLKDGNKVKVTIRFRGRQITHSEIGRQVMNEFADRIKEYGTVDKAPQIEGRNMSMFISPRASD